MTAEKDMFHIISSTSKNKRKKKFPIFNCGGGGAHSSFPISHSPSPTLHSLFLIPTFTS